MHFNIWLFSFLAPVHTTHIPLMAFIYITTSKDWLICFELHGWLACQRFFWAFDGGRWMNLLWVFVQNNTKFFYNVGILNAAQVANCFFILFYFILFYCILLFDAFLEWLQTVKSMISKYAPDVCLQVELCHKATDQLERRQQPPYQLISSQLYPRHSKHTPVAPLHSS